jgi:GNAT superfamily N-acetyltransferase
MHYCPATPADAAALADMNWQLIRDEGHRNPMTVPQLADRMARWLGGQYEAVLFEEAGRPVGYALFRREPEHIYLRHFFVARDCRRRGVGRAALG